MLLAGEIIKGELRRFSPVSGPRRSTAAVSRAGPVHCRESGRVIANARAALACVVQRTDDWPAFGRWSELLPVEFIQRCAPEPEPDPSFDVHAWLQTWQAMTPEQKSAFNQRPWTLSDWLYSFDPTEDGTGDDRSW